MIFDLFLKFLCYFGGILLFLVNLTLFNAQFSHAVKISMFFFSLIPVAGLVLNIFVFLYALSMYQRDGFYHQDLIQVKRTHLNRWLFDDVNWKEWDEEINKQQNK